MERDIFIGKAGVDYGAGLILATGGKWTIESLTLGGIALFNQDQSVIDGTATVLAADITGDKISIGMMMPTGIKFGVEMLRKSFKYTKQAYVAPVVAVKYLGDDAAAASGNGDLNLPSTISVAQAYGVSIRDRSKSHEDTSAIRNYILNVVTGDITTLTTSANIITKLVALINADTHKIVTAVAMNDGTDNDGIRFTADTAGVDFDIITVDGILKNSDIVEYHVINGVYDSGSTTATANNPGQGTPAQVAKAELDSNVQSGKTNTQLLTKYMWSEGSLVVSTETYTIYSLSFIPAQDSQIDRDNNFIQLAQIFVPSGETGANELVTVLDEIFALVNP